MIVEAICCLAQNIYFEARSQALIEQVAVAQVVMNRVRSPHYPNSVCDVVWERRQFSWTHDGKSDKPRNPNAWLEANQIASLVLSPSFPDLVDGATHYHAHYVSPTWANSLESVATIGTHKFYR